MRQENKGQENQSQVLIADWASFFCFLIFLSKFICGRVQNEQETAIEKKPGNPISTERNQPERSDSACFFGLIKSHRWSQGGQNLTEFPPTPRIHRAVLVKPPTFRLPFPIRCALGANWLVGQEVSGLAIIRNVRARWAVVPTAGRTNGAGTLFTIRLLLTAFRSRCRKLID
jgi:hypothetical protein